MKRCDIFQAMSAPDHWDLVRYEDAAKRIAELEASLKEAVRLLREGKHMFAPNTTNSDVDYFLERYGK